MTTSPRPAAASRCDSSACVQVDVYDGEHLTEPVVRVLSTETDTRMQCRAGEWLKFITEIKNGDWDHVGTDLEFAIARKAAASMVFVPDLIDHPGSLNGLVDAAECKAR